MRYIDILLIEGTCPTSGKAEKHKHKIYQNYRILWSFLVGDKIGILDDLWVKERVSFFDYIKLVYCTFDSLHSFF